MSSHERGRSPSAGQAGHLRNTTSASPHPPLDASFAGPNPFNPEHVVQPASTAFSDSAFTQDGASSANYFLGPSYTDFRDQHSGQLGPQSADITNHTFLQSQGLPNSNDASALSYAAGGPGGNHVAPGALSQHTSPGGASNTDTSAFPSFEFDQAGFEQDGVLDPSILTDIDPSSIDLLPSQQGLANNPGSLDPMAAMQSHSPTPPHLLPEMAHHQSRSPSPNASPSIQQGNFQYMSRQRNLSETLDPSTAMFPQGQNEWTNMGAYRGHRRTPSDNYSEYSSHSNQASPYMPTADNFDANAQSSPLLNSMQDPAFNDGLGLQQFSLNETQAQPQPQQPSYNHSPSHSPHPSPRLSPQQPLPPFTAENNYGLTANINGQFMQQQRDGLDMFPGTGQEPFPSLNHQSPGDMGHADQMSPPEINIEYAPLSKNPVENARPGHDDEALSPPMRTPSRGGRMRAKSDSYAGSRPSSPSVPARGRSPSLQPSSQAAADNLAPFDSRSNASRSSSPARGRNGSLSARNRSSSNASDQRDYILDLANPERTPSNGADKRVQKHPATFQCHLCPKRFTRAYNLRSHLRTHTDERPFVCTVCGKAFARQHDRKRHEGLHSGEKKFVCRGTLQSGSQWGCGRRFARADALGRHFRSEAGRVCIKPLLDEEAADRQRAWMEEQQQQQVAAGLVVPQPMVGAPQPIDMMGNFLPAALLQQYPALAGIDWNSVPQGPPPEEDYSGRSSFEASSGGEYYDDMSDNEMASYPDPQLGGMSNMAMQQDMGPGMGMQAPQPHPGSAAAQGYGVYGNQAGDYLSDFEGR